MVNQREPPRVEGVPLTKRIGPVLSDRTNQPEFGKASPLRNPMKASPNNILFNIPRGDRPRPEHHQPAQSIARPQQDGAPKNPPFRMPDFTFGNGDRSSPLAETNGLTSQVPVYNFNAGAGVQRPRPAPNNIINLSSSAANSPSLMEVPRPPVFAPRDIPPVARPTFSSSTFQSANIFRSPIQQRDDDDDFDPDSALRDVKFAEPDPMRYVDAAQASENIKALLEGAFEDDEDKPRTRLRKKKQVAAASDLADQLAGLEVDGKDTRNDKEKEEEDEEEGEEEEDDGTVEGLKVKLLPHQIDGVAWMMDREIGGKKKNGVSPKGGILADDMGLGKTIQALSLILNNPRPTSAHLAANPKLKISSETSKGTLVVAPLALIKQWEAEIKDKVLDSHRLKVLVHHGPSRTKRFEDLKKYDVVITTYQTLTSEHDGSSDNEKGVQVGCFGVQWYRVILDEAHSIKNRNAKMTKAAYALRSVYRWCLTGTPMQNNADELQSLIRFLRIKPYCELSSWKAQIGDPLKKGRGGIAIKRLQYFLKAVMKRRTKAVLQKEGGLKFGKGGASDDSQQAGFKIVGRKVETVVCEFEEGERCFYDKLQARTEKNLEDMMGGAKTDYIGALVLLLRLRQTCNHRELIKNNLRKDKESLGTTIHTGSGSQTPRKGKASSLDDLDDITNMFGGLAVQSQKCDVCQSALNKSEMASGAVRCSHCDEDIKGADQKVKAKVRTHSSQPSKVPKKTSSAPVRRGLHTRRIVNSDDEDNGGDWVVPRGEQKVTDLEVTGGTDDEDAEGGGDWLGPDHSDTDDEDVKPRTRRQQRTSKDDSFIERDDSFFDEFDQESDDSAPSIEEEQEDTSLIPSTKIRELLKILDKESEDHKFIVFSEFTSMLDIIEPFLIKGGYRFVRYDGKMKNDDRETSLRRLREDKDVRILLCSLRCGSLGLNLTVASRVIIIEPFWNPFVEEQAIDRVHRLNQTQDVIVYRLTIANSVEERILELQAKKRELANAAIEGGGKAVGKLSMKDIMNLFRKDAENAGHHEDVSVASVMAGMSGGLLQQQQQQASPAKKATSSGSSFQQAALQRQRERSAFKAPPNVSPQFDAAYGRRW